MLQIIGLLGCVYLFVKGLELLGSASRMHPPLRGIPLSEFDAEDRKAWDWEARGMGLTKAGGVLAIVLSLIFAFWLILAGDQLAQRTSTIGYDSTTSKTDCITNATTLDELNRC